MAEQRRVTERIAHLAFASPPLFTAIGVLSFIAGKGGFDWLAWIILWTLIGGTIALPPRPAKPPATPPWLRGAHGALAAFVLLIFLIAHLANHLFALWSPALHGSVMRWLEQAYRQRLVEPTLVIGMAFLVVSGVTLAWPRTARMQDGYGVLQTLTGVYLSVFIMSHLIAVFVLTRLIQHAPTDWAFASGGPSGLLGDSWNVRLIPHYFGGVWALMTHVGLGVRQVARAHLANAAWADRLSWSFSAAGVVLAALIVSALIGLHFGVRTTVL